MWIIVLPKGVRTGLGFEPSTLGLRVKWMNHYTLTWGAFKGRQRAYTCTLHNIKLGGGGGSLSIIIGQFPPETTFFKFILTKHTNRKIHGVARGIGFRAQILGEREGEREEQEGKGRYK